MLFTANTITAIIAAMMRSFTPILRIKSIASFISLIMSLIILNNLLSPVNATDWCKFEVLFERCVIHAKFDNLLAKWIELWNEELF